MEAYVHAVVVRDGKASVIFSGCNFKCPTCNVPQLVEFRTGEVLALRDVTSQLDAARANTILFTGGEPTLQRQALVEILTHCRSKLPHARLILDTNGSKPQVIEQLVSMKLIDEIWLDLKAPRASFDKATHAGTFFEPSELVHDEITRTVRLLAAGAGAQVARVCQTLIVPGLLSRDDVLALAPVVAQLDAEWCLVPFAQGVVLDKRLARLATPSATFLDGLAAAIREKYPRLRVRSGSPIEEFPIQPDGLGAGVLDAD